MLPDIHPEELSATLDSVALEALQRAAVDNPPIDAVAIAKALGLTVAWDDRQTGRARRAAIGGAAAASIFLRHDPRPEREQWAVAHEIGESLCEQVFRQLGIDPQTAPRQAREQIANGIAGRLLLPRDWFANDAAACGWDLFALKEQYSNASHELIARRMLDFSTPVIVGVYDQNRVNWRKANSGSRVPKSSPQEIECRRTAHETGEVASTSGPPTIRAWPIHEAMWKREIVRVELDEFADSM
jgi:Zn-dependent peptidase ImmA (M78 family)